MNKRWGGLKRLGLILLTTKHMRLDHRFNQAVSLYGVSESEFIEHSPQVKIQVDWDGGRGRGIEEGKVLT